MLKRSLSVLTIAALACATSVAKVSAQDSGVGRGETVSATAAMEPGVEAGAGLKAEMLKLVAETRAGRRARQSPPPQRQAVPSNGLSKGQKVAIGVAASAGVILVIMMSRRGSSDRFIAPPCPPGQLCQ